MTRLFLLYFLVIAVVAGGFDAGHAKGAIVVKSISMTVSDTDRAVEFYSALTFQKVSDVEVLGDEFEHRRRNFTCGGFSS